MWYKLTVARKSIASLNPIRRVRLEHHKTLENFAFECGISLQAVYLNECGVYPHILPSIEHRLTSYYSLSAAELTGEYERYVQGKRFEFGKSHIPYILPESNKFKSPILSFRELLTKTRIGFAKAICIQPTLLSKTENGIVEEIPSQIILALREIQLPVGDIRELQDRHQEFVFRNG